jgi:hypothetical protein
VGSEFQPDPTAAKLDSKALGKLDAAMEKQVADKKVSGVIGLIARNGKVGYYETHGQRFIEQDKPMAKDTLFRIYSMTKPIVAVTAMAIWEEGKFKLDDPIATYCPEWKEPVVRNGEGTEKAKSPVTARQLFTHSSGLTYDRKDLNLSPTATLEEFSASAAKKPLKFHPGTQYAYGYSTDILGRYIEAVEGKPLDVGDARARLRQIGHGRHRFLGAESGGQGARRDGLHQGERRIAQTRDEDCGCHEEADSHDGRSGADVDDGRLRTLLCDDGQQGRIRRRPSAESGDHRPDASESPQGH